jgi:hypothetical protein
MFFILSFVFFSPVKSGKRRVEQVLPKWEGWHQREEGGVGKRVWEGEYGAI